MISIALISIPISQNDKLMKWGGIESFLDSGEIFDKNFQNFQFIKMTGRDQLTIILNSHGTRRLYPHGSVLPRNFIMPFPMIIG